MHTLIPLTRDLLFLIGVYELALGIGGLAGRFRWAELIDEFDRSPALTLVTGFVSFGIGGAIALAHHHWTDAPAIIVTAIGWIAIIEGVLLMAFPGHVLGFARKLVSNHKAISWLALLVGAALILLALVTRADATLL